MSQAAAAGNTKSNNWPDKIVVGSAARDGPAVSATRRRNTVKRVARFRTQSFVTGTFRSSSAPFGSAVCSRVSYRVLSCWLAAHRWHKHNAQVQACCCLKALVRLAPARGGCVQQRMQRPRIIDRFRMTRKTDDRPGVKADRGCHGNSRPR